MAKVKIVIDTTDKKDVEGAMDALDAIYKSLFGTGEAKCKSCSGDAVPEEKNAKTKKSSARPKKSSAPEADHDDEEGLSSEEQEALDDMSVKDLRKELARSASEYKKEYGRAKAVKIIKEFGAVDAKGSVDMKRIADEDLVDAIKALAL